MFQHASLLVELKTWSLTKPIRSAAVFVLLAVMIIGGCTTINRGYKDREPACTTELKCIGQKIYNNETGGKLENLIFWSPNEAFPSLGIGHFIWYPAAEKQGFKEAFPDLVRYLQANGAKVPLWLSRQIQIGSLWNSREQMEQDRSSRKFRELQQLLLDTTDLQTTFLFERLDKALPTMLSAVSPESRALITDRFNTMKATTGGLYPLVDYVNFKGEGTAMTERYNGQGWGLLQVLENMQAVPAGPQALQAFSRAADVVLSRRVENAAPEKNEQRWLPGWRVRLNTYYVAPDKPKWL